MTSIVPVTPMKGFKFGCDPELFVTNGNGEFVSAEGLIPGTKEEPHAVERGAVQVDGMAAEFNIDPAETFQEFNDSITAVLKQLQGILPVGYNLHALPSVNFSQEVWDKASYNSKQLGCSPDFNAWTGEVNPPPQDLENPRLRTASGHIHIGWTDNREASDLQHLANCRDLVKQLDWYLGSWSLTKDGDPMRRRLYGKAGACRFKPYGVEYRVLSNFWVLDKDLRLLVWNKMNNAIHCMRSEYLPDLGSKFVRRSILKKGTTWNDLLIQSISDSSVNETLLKTFPLQFKDIENI